MWRLAPPSCSKPALEQPSRYYQFALACWALPLLVGVSAFVLWLFLRSDWLALVGIFDIVWGMILFVIGVGALGGYWMVVRASQARPRRFWLSMSLCAGLLLSNFPVAAGLIAAVIAIETRRFVVTIRNDSEETLREIRIVGGGRDVALEPIAPGNVGSRSIWIRGDGELVLHFRRGNSRQDALIAGYVTGEQGGEVVVVIEPDGRVSCNPPAD
jgi:hypothetical protein